MAADSHSPEDAKTIRPWQFASVTEGPVKLAGTAAAAKRWNDGRAEVTLLAAGKAERGQLILDSEMPATKKRRTTSSQI